MTISERIAITGATGQLGRLVIAELLRIAPAAHLIGIVRNASAAKDLAERGVELRTANYDDPDAIKAALAGADKVLLISSSEIGQR
ncbi:NAD(P)H-binding protein, partial [Bradyrhizobium sp. BRP19]|nr:NAD(P)H-binding protein [Bradyrhizobium sp. BRP19]